MPAANAVKRLRTLLINARHHVRSDARCTTACSMRTLQNGGVTTPGRFSPVSGKEVAAYDMAVFVQRSSAVA